jgi:hypothetical protein
VVRLAGKGAGRWPTALSVLGDVHEYLRDRRALTRPANTDEVLVQVVGGVQ